VAFIGTVIESPAKGQKIELQADLIQVLGGVPENYPLAKKKHSLEYLREILHLRPRTHVFGAMARVRNALAFATHEFFHRRGFIYCNTPLLTGADCEGAGEMFQVTTLLQSAKDVIADVKRGSDGKADYGADFFKKPTYLAVSGQLNVESYACSLSNVYTFGPTFRAEKSKTTRHLAEFWMIEPEIAFADLTENMNVAEAYIKHTLKYVLETCADDIAFFESKEEEWIKENKAAADKAQMEANKAAKLAAKQAQQAKKTGGGTSDATSTATATSSASEGEKPATKKIQVAGSGAWTNMKLRDRLRNTIDSPFERITYTRAIEILKASGEQFEEQAEWGIDLPSEMERYLAEVVYKKPIILTDYPKAIKAFYMRANDDGKTVAAMDILVPGIGELVGGSQREERLELLEARMRDIHLDAKDYAFYCDLRKYGTVPHAGFGLGFERLVRYATGLDNIKDTCMFPRAWGTPLEG
jgi:asparaginyl-tRNA synthetase